MAIFEHELYDASNYDNDLTLIKTTDNITMSELVVPICAPDPSESYEGYDAEASGWGTLSSGTERLSLLSEYWMFEIFRLDFRVRILLVLYIKSHNWK